MRLYTVYSFFFNDTATTEIYTLSLHDALPISAGAGYALRRKPAARRDHRRREERGRGDPHVHRARTAAPTRELRSEEHTSELQSRLHLVCRLLLEKKKNYCPSAVNSDVQFITV